MTTAQHRTWAEQLADHRDNAIRGLTACHDRILALYGQQGVDLLLEGLRRKDELMRADLALQELNSRGVKLEADHELTVKDVVCDMEAKKHLRRPAKRMRLLDDDPLNVDLRVVHESIEKEEEEGHEDYDVDDDDNNSMVETPSKKPVVNMMRRRQTKRKARF